MYRVRECKCQGQRGPSPRGICDPASTTSNSSALYSRSRMCSQPPCSRFAMVSPGLGKEVNPTILLPDMPGSLGGCRGQASRTGQREGCRSCCVSSVILPQADANPVSSTLIMRALVFNNLSLNKLENKLSGFFPKQILSMEPSEASLKQRAPTRYPQGTMSPVPRELTPGEADEGQF